MKPIGVIIILILKILSIENRMIPLNYGSTTQINRASSISTPEIVSLEDKDNPSEKVLALKRYDELETEEYFDYERKASFENSKPCAIVVLSNIQNPSMKSLLRKYRYDANGVLIPDSVKYFVKVPQGMRTAPILVPLNDKAFSASGGFVRYYKEVPPIPHSW